MKNLLILLLDFKGLPYRDKILIAWNMMGFTTNIWAWLDDNKLFASNVIFFGLPTAVYTFWRFRQKYHHQEELNKLELIKIKKEIGVKDEVETQE